MGREREQTKLCDETRDELTPTIDELTPTIDELTPTIDELTPTIGRKRIAYQPLLPKISFIADL